jgi:hypothetical protein
MIKLCIPRSCYHCVAIAGRVTLMRLSKVARGVPPEDGFLLTCMFLLNGRTSIFFHCLLTTSGESRRLHHAWPLWSNGWLNSATPVFRHTKEFTLWSICPLGHREKLAYEWPRLANPSCDPADSEILISFTATAALMSFLSYIAVTDAKVTRPVSCMFDKSMISARSATMPKPYFSENHLHSVRIFIFSDLIFCYY